MSNEEAMDDAERQKLDHPCSMDDAQRLNPHDERRVAVEAGCDPRTVRARLRGQRQRSTVAARVDFALRKLGFEPPSAGQPEGPPSAGQPEGPPAA